MMTHGKGESKPPRGGRSRSRATAEPSELPDWLPHPLIYEINTWVWLEELGAAQGRHIDLASVPEREWDRLTELGFHVVWLMGVWERSPKGIELAASNTSLVADFRRALPDFRESDNVGSPYCVREYRVDPRLGGDDGLAVARQALARRGLRLMLDFVPNHVALDHPWAAEHPEYFIQGTREDLEKEPAAFVAHGDRVFACGRDPYFPAWPDVVQLHAFHPGLRVAAKATLDRIARQCDALRCDMAMLLMNDVFERTWGSRAGERPDAEYWREVIPHAKRANPALRFVAEAYWDLEYPLMQLGFDFCYDKRLYDRLEHAEVEQVRLHLTADVGYQARLVRFIENHDEPRATVAFPKERHRAAAVAALTLPGARLIHEGQMDGRSVRLPVFLSRRPPEAAHPEVRELYQRLLAALCSPSLMRGRWEPCATSGWNDNASFHSLLAWCWSADEGLCIVVVNLSGANAQGHVRVPSWTHVGERTWTLSDWISSERYVRRGSELAEPGLYVDLPPWGTHLLDGQVWDSP
jgi:hypothetical protein